MITRRKFIKASVGAGLGLLSLSTYAFGIEPSFLLNVTEYKINPQQWHKNTPLTIAVLTDIHAGGYNMPLSRVEEIVERTNALNCDMIVYLGDTLANYTRFKLFNAFSEDISFIDVAKILKNLKAPLGVFSVLGNHDWWDDPTAQANFKGPTLAHKAFAGEGLRILENDAIKLIHKGKPIWLAGLGDQMAFPPRRARARGIRRGVDDISGTFEKIRDNSPVIMLMHEPNAFSRLPDRVSLALSGHTHGGQVSFFGLRPTQLLIKEHPYLYGHFQEERKNLIVSGGLGCSHLPLRIGVPPEIVKVTVS